jgi:hypothetical protein
MPDLPRAGKGNTRTAIGRIGWNAWYYFLK